jgi:hypothetical protein
MSNMVNVIHVPLIEMGEDKARERKCYFCIINCQHHIVTDMSTARQQIGKHIPEVPLSKIEGRPLLCNGPINTHSWQ